MEEGFFLEPTELSTLESVFLDSKDVKFTVHSFLEQFVATAHIVGAELYYVLAAEGPRVLAGGFR